MSRDLPESFTPAALHVVKQIRGLDSDIEYQREQVKRLSARATKAQEELDRLIQTRAEFRSFIPHISDTEVSS